VIHNVVLNAIQAMPRGGTVKVAADNVVLSATFAGPLPKGRYVKIAITDQGCGIADDIVTQIFDPYFTTKPQGSGLGLAIAYAIIAKHEGYLTLDSEVGVGTTFYFYLPKASQPLDTMPQPAAHPRLGSGHLLIVDDEAYILDLLEEMLNRMGYDVTCHDDGKDAIATYQRAFSAGRGFAAVILDSTIPGGMGGYETIAHLQAIDPGVKGNPFQWLCQCPGHGQLCPVRLQRGAHKALYAGAVARSLTTDSRPLTDVMRTRLPSVV
jgi:CheY-like chemotaxis protein